MSYGKYVYLKNKVRMQKIILILNVGMLSAFIGNQAMKTSIVTNDVLLENVEALANYESPEIIICDFSGNFICPANGKKVGYVYKGYSLR